MAAIGAALLASAAAAEPCAPWPGEPRPLPRVGDTDEMRQRWAELRVQELSQAARAIEAESPVRAHHLWRRVLCLDPANDAAVAGLARTPLVVVHQPALVTQPIPPTDADAWSLSQPLHVAPPRPPRRESPVAQPAPSGPDFAVLVASLEEEVRNARFEEALGRVDAARSAAQGPDQSARVEVLAATAALALGRDADADVHLSRALAADPELALDPMTTPPKVRRALERVRAEQAP